MLVILHDTMFCESYLNYKKQLVCNKVEQYLNHMERKEPNKNCLTGIIVRDNISFILVLRGLRT